MAIPSQKKLELWGGLECTINRVGDRFSSQLARSGHFTREGDLERIAELGIRTLRFPILWEHLAPKSLDAIDWSWTDRSLGKLRELGLRPIVGLLHHGSGPAYTDLLDVDFAPKLARFAAAVAQRYPWVDAFTPVNEPLTTARFSGLYGLWYPHGKDPLTFARCALNQIRGVVAAMQAIREVNPLAQLIQTEDLGKTFSTPKLQYQADFENERRWLTWDLLCGRVSANHPVGEYLRWLGISGEDLSAFENEPCAPDVIGVNHYVTSERYLDQNPTAYAPEAYGGNGRQRYADVAAVRVRPEGVSGPESLLRETCERYGLPVAVTEAHLGCSREEQLRWFNEIWQTAQQLRRDGYDVRGVTAWSLFGAFDWDSLLTREEGNYEPGAFDLSSGQPRETAVAHLLRKVGRGEEFGHPVLRAPGWWKRPTRLTSLVSRPADLLANYGMRPLIFLKDDSGISEGFEHAAHDRALAFRTFSISEICDLPTGELTALFESFDPWAVINCADGFDPDLVEEDHAASRALVVEMPGKIAAICAALDVPLAVLSSAHVLDSEGEPPYAETGWPKPPNVFGELKFEMESRVSAVWPRALIVRIGDLFGTGRTHDSVASALSTLDDGRRLTACDDVQFSVTYLPDLVRAVLDLLIDGEHGIWHVAHDGAVTAKRLATRAAEIADLDSSLVDGAPQWSFGLRANRAANRSLMSSRGTLVPPLESALQHYVSVVLADAEPTRASLCS